MRKIYMALATSLVTTLVGCVDDGSTDQIDTTDGTTTDGKADRGGTPTDMPDYKVFANCSILRTDDQTSLLSIVSPAMTVSSYVQRNHNVVLVLKSTTDTAMFTGTVEGIVDLTVNITNHQDFSLTVRDVKADKEMQFAGTMDLSPTRHGQILSFAPAFESAELLGYALTCTRN